MAVNTAVYDKGIVVEVASVPYYAWGKDSALGQRLRAMTGQQIVNLLVDCAKVLKLHEKPAGENIVETGKRMMVTLFDTEGVRTKLEALSKSAMPTLTIVDMNYVSPMSLPEFRNIKNVPQAQFDLEKNLMSSLSGAELLTALQTLCSKVNFLDKRAGEDFVVFLNRMSVAWDANTVMNMSASIMQKLLVDRQAAIAKQEADKQAAIAQQQAEAAALAQKQAEQAALAAKTQAEADAARRAQAEADLKAMAAKQQAEAAALAQQKAEIAAMQQKAAEDAKAKIPSWAWIAGGAVAGLLLLTLLRR